MRAVTLNPQLHDAHDRLDRVRDSLVTVLSLNRRGGQDKDAMLRHWSDAVSMLSALDLSGAESDVVAEATALLTSGDDAGDELFQSLFQLVHDLHDDVMASLLVVPLPDTEVTSRARDFEAQIRDALYHQLHATREARIQVVRDWIFENPGHFILEIDRRLRQDRMLDVSYAAIHSYVRELESRGEILTLGWRQGIPRYCFPHPNKVGDRAKYFGQLFPVKGDIDREVTDEFQTIRTMARVYVVNHDMKAIGFVTPPNVSLASHMKVEAYGPLQSWENLASVHGLRALDGPPENVDGVVMAKQVDYTNQAGQVRHLILPREFAGV